MIGCGTTTNSWNSQAMFNSKELDMLLENPTTKKKVYVKYHLSGTKGVTSMSRLGTVP